MRTREEIQKEVADLLEIKPQVRRTTFFGDSNWAAIDTQVSVLQDGLNEDYIYNAYGQDEHLLNAALEAYGWVIEDGEIDSLVDEWRTLIVGGDDQP
jgi:hypothetical protein